MGFSKASKSNKAFGWARIAVPLSLTEIFPGERVQMNSFRNNCMLPGAYWPDNLGTYACSHSAAHPRNVNPVGSVHPISGWRSGQIAVTWHQRGPLEPIKAPRRENSRAGEIKFPKQAPEFFFFIEKSEKQSCFQ